MVFSNQLWQGSTWEQHARVTGPGATRGGFSNKQRGLCGGTRRAPISSPGRGPPPLLRHRPSPYPPAGGARRTASLSSSSSCRPRLCTHLATGVGAHIRGKTTSGDRRGDGWEGSREELVEPVLERSADRWIRRRFSRSVWDGGAPLDLFLSSCGYPPRRQNHTFFFF